MTTRWSLGIWGTTASMILAATGCAHEPTASPPATPTTITAAPTKSAPRYESAQLGVSSELIRACQVRFDDPASAPKFGFDESAMLSQDRSVLDQVAKCVTSGPLAGRKIELIGRTDPRGTVEYNFLLGERRASGVEGYLAGDGVDRAKMMETSRGELDAKGSDETSWQRDRRVDIELR